MKQRVEDLGRISEQLHALMEHSLFRHLHTSSVERFINTLKNEDESEKLFYQLENVLQGIQKCFKIARYSDEEPPQK